MFKKAKEILEGWAKYESLMPVSVKEIEVVEARAQVCATCPNIKESDLISFMMPDKELKEIQGHKCGLCGCPLSTKVRSTTSKCPDTPPRWKE